MATVLVVDDDPISRDFLRTLLGYRGHDACEAADGETALTLARDRVLDAVITDVLMPNLGGYELARMLRSQPATSHLPIAFSTAHYRHDEIEPMARACGVQDVIFKPAQPTAVLATIDALLGAVPGRARPGGLAGPTWTRPGDLAGPGGARPGILSGPGTAPPGILSGYVQSGYVEDAGAGSEGRTKPAASSADRLAETHRITQSGTWDLDPRTGAIMLSAGVCELLRLASPAVRPEELRQRIHPEDVAKLAAMARNTWRTGLPGHTEIRAAGMDGTVHELLVSCRPCAERPATLWGVVQDVTHLRQTRRTDLRTQAAWYAERRAAESFHRAALPRVLPSLAGADLGALYLTAPERLDIGTGWYDARQTSDGRILLSVGEVAGHDQPAAAAMSPILAVLRAYALDDIDPARLLTRLNRFLAATRQDDTYVTAVVATYEPDTGRLCIANAGHPRPLVILPGGDGDPVAASLAQRGPALGVLPEVEFTGRRLTLAAGSVLCLYTDGLIDRHSDPAWPGSRRLPHAALRALDRLAADDPLGPPDAQDLAEGIVRAVLGGDAPDDDACLAVLWAGV